jgi:hypothetical protein
MMRLTEIGNAAHCKAQISFRHADETTNTRAKQVPV